MWREHWQQENYIQGKKEHFEILDRVFSSPPKLILDIGCGLAFESEMFQKKYGSELYLLDGEKTSTKRETLYGSVDDFGYYHTIKELKDNYNQRNMIYTFVDANDIKISDGVIFDLIFSAQSCGHHYPADTYKTLIEKHSNENTKIIFDIRKGSNQTSFETIRVLKNSRKYDTIELRFIK